MTPPGGAHFNLLAERVYSSEQIASPTRLVGMMVRLKDRDEEGRAHVLAAAYARQREDADLPYQGFVRDGAGWRGQDTGERHASIHAVRSRLEQERMMVLTPLVARDGQERELLGFVSMTWRSEAELTSAAGDLLSEVSQHLGPLLRHSSLYMLSARKLWILKAVRQHAERAQVRGERGDASVERFIGHAADLLAEHVDVPSFGIAYMKHSPEQGRVLCYAHPHGWSRDEGIELRVDVPEAQRTDSGVSSLAVRFNRPLVLAGGYGEGDDFGFKNSLFVNERSGRLEDVRSGKLKAPGPGQGDDKAGEPTSWVALSDYYKPARRRAYATLAFPVTFAGEALGVLTVEVDKETDWLWWTGFGGHLFWQLFASELAAVFFALGVRASPPEPH